MVEKIKTETSEEKEAAAKYLQEELNFRLKSLEGKPDALCQAYQVAIRALRPEFKHYVVTIASSKIRNSQAKIQGNWRHVYGDVIFDEFPAQSMDEAKETFKKRYPSMALEDVQIMEYVLPI